MAMQLKTQIRDLRQKTEDMALEDMNNQEQMVKDTEAEMSFVKFRLPYAFDNTPLFYTYLKGRVFFQAMNRCNSTECRLMVIPENSHTYPPRSLVRDGQTSPHRPRLVVSHSTCPPLSSSPHANSFVIGPAVIKHTAGASCCSFY
jgi:hypothetical protein